MVSLDVAVIPDLVEKKKKKKSKKRKGEEAADAGICQESDDIENNALNGESKPKKKKKNKDKAPQSPPEEAIPVETEKLKKKKKKAPENGDCEVEEEEETFDVDSGVFKKKFYTPDDVTQAMTKVLKDTEIVLFSNKIQNIY